MLRDTELGRRIAIALLVKAGKLELRCLESLNETGEEPTNNPTLAKLDNIAQSGGRLCGDKALRANQSDVPI